MPISVRNLTASDFAVEVLGATALKDERDRLEKPLNYLWLKHRVLLFRNCEFSEGDQVAFSSMFGLNEIHGRIEFNSPDHPELIYVTNRKKPDGSPMGALSNNEAGWHFDQSYLPRPAIGSLLYAVEVPSAGGDTSFADLYGAYDSLSEETKRRIEGLKAEHDYDKFNRSYHVPANEFQKKRTRLVEVHPVVRTHPITFRKAIYVAPAVTTRILGLPEAESDRLLEELYAAQVRPELVYRHRWRPGDALLWDNSCTLHRREPFSNDEIRFMRRTTIRAPEALSVPV